MFYLQISVASSAWRDIRALQTRRSLTRHKTLQLSSKSKLHFAYRGKNMTDHATRKNRMSKALRLQNFLSDARQL